MYIESRAYVSNLRQKLVCGSPLLAPRMRYYEWYSRALVPGTHFVQVVQTLTSMTALHVLPGVAELMTLQALTTPSTHVAACLLAPPPHFRACVCVSQVADGADMCDDFVRKVPAAPGILTTCSRHIVVV